MPRRRIDVDGAPQTLVFDVVAWAAAMKGSKRTRLAVQLLEAFNWDDRAAADVLAALAQACWRPKPAKKKPAGRPGQWSNGNELYAWLVVEAQHRADKRRDSAATVQNSRKKLFDALPRARRKHPGLCVLQDLSDAKRNLYVTPDAAKKYYQKGKAFLASANPAVRDYWNTLADRASLAKGKN